MTNILIKDLEGSRELDKQAMAGIMGGYTYKEKLKKTYLGVKTGSDGYLHKFYRIRYKVTTIDSRNEDIEKQGALVRM
ncbi:hypothetical protein [Desulfonema magnum]|uniref:Uncharacterized protein n=1 Tax=Desulfonema magnum TaxID=45655 RepID=A0A975BSW1_9BACT|nr:hypothetical protein [Desulfonema magnum]QTA91174.1 Uncharacterized protein dnm_072390 [Desulfonema magnum]